jgi:hypothetical protein
LFDRLIYQGLALALFTIHSLATSHRNLETVIEHVIGDLNNIKPTWTLKTAQIPRGTASLALVKMAAGVGKTFFEELDICYFWARLRADKT